MKKLYLLSLLLWGSTLFCQNTGDLRSCRSGDWDSPSTWQVWKGSIWQSAIASDIPQSTTTKSINIRSTHVINFAYGARYVYDLIIDSGGVMKETVIGSAGKSLIIHHNVVCNGTIGNGTVPGKIVLSFQGSNCSISGNGIIDCYQIRALTFAGNINLEIKSNINLRAPGVEIYNYNNNYNFNINIPSGVTVNCLGDGNFDGDFFFDNTQGSVPEYGGNLIVDGELNISGIFYASSNNNSRGCTYIINDGGSVSCKGINMSSSGTAGTQFTINSGGRFSLKGADGSSVFSLNNNTYNLDGIFEYSSSGVQTIRSFNYGYLKLSGTGNKIIEASKIVSIRQDGTLELSGGAAPAQLLQGTGTLSVNNSGTTLLYSAAGAQNTGIEWNYPFENLVLNKSNNLTVSNSKVFTGTISLNSGNVLIGNYDLNVKVISGGNSSSYIVLNGTGKLKAYVDSSNVLFPIGESTTSYTPVTLRNSGGIADYYSLKCTTFIPVTKDTGLINKLWAITEDTPGGSNLILSFQWNGVDEIAPFNRVNAAVGVREGTTIDFLASSHVNGTDPYIITTIVPYIGEMTSEKTFNVGNPSDLPIELTSFSCSVEIAQVRLDWVTITENNSYGFYIQRKNNSAEWEDVGFVRAYGSSNSPRYYSWKEKITGHYFYRLKIMDVDGYYEYSKIITTDIQGPKFFQLFQNYPNPFNPSTRIKYSVPDGEHKIKLTIHNILGDEVLSLIDGKKEGGEYEVMFEPDLLSSGIYFYRLKSETTVLIKKMCFIK